MDKRIGKIVDEAVDQCEKCGSLCWRRKIIIL